MITLHILQLLQNEGFGTLETDLFWEKLPLNKNGVAIYSRGGSLNRQTSKVQPFDLYSRGTNDLLGADKLEKIWEYFTKLTICDLPTTAKSNKIYRNVRFTPSSIENLGQDETDRLVFRLSAEVIYTKEPSE